MASIPIDPAASKPRTLYLRDATRKSGRAGLSTGLLLIDSLMAIGFAAALAAAIGAVAAGANPTLPCFWLVLMGGARAMVLALGARSGARGALEVKRSVRSRVASAAFRAFPGSVTTGECLATIIDEVEALDGYVARFLPAKRAAGLSPFLILGAVALASPVAALILTSTFIPFIGVMILAGRAAAGESRRQFEAMSRLSMIFLDRLRALPLLLAFDAGGVEAARVEGAAQDVARRTLRILSRAFLSSAGLELFASLGIAFVAVYAGLALLGLSPVRTEQHLSLGQAAFVLALAPEFYLSFRRLAAAYHDRQMAKGAADRLMAIEARSTPLPAHAPIHVATAPDIQFRNVTVRYPGTTIPAVSDISFHARRGETVALLGPSGCGKSTILHALLGLAPLCEGEILVDGECLAPNGMVTAGWAGQVPLIVAGSVAENIALGAPFASRSDIEAAMHAAGLAQAIESRPGGLDSWIDERGGGLSGGERRRIGLARALLSDAPLLLLDEPTAHLDVESAQSMVDILARAARGRTVIVATHCEAMASLADHVVVMGGVS